jgi:drug/metabolite transporter (DMT)-like permease
MALIWGVNISVVKYGTAAMPPLAYNSLRVAIAAAVLMALGTRAGVPWPSRRDMLTLLGLGTLGNGLYQILFVEGVAHTRAGNAALVLAATPALIALFGWARGVERPTVRSTLGICLSIAGVLFVVGTSAFEATTSSIAGDGLILAGCVCWALFTVFLKPFVHRINGIHVAALTMLGGLPPLFLFATPDLLSTSWSQVPVLGWVSMLFSGVGALVLAYMIWHNGVKVLGPTRTAMYSNLQPAIALLFAWPLLGEVPTLMQGLGAGGIISGVLLARS